MTEWTPVSPSGCIWRWGPDVLVWRRYKVEGGIWSAVRAGLEEQPRHGFESMRAAAEYALADDLPPP